MIGWIRSYFAKSHPLPQLENVDPPPELLCPIGQSLMQHPVSVIHLESTSPQSVSKVSMWAWAWAWWAGNASQPSPVPSKALCHIFEKAAIAQWASEKQTCPTCRGLIDSQEFNPVDLTAVQEAFYTQHPHMRPCPEFPSVNPEDFEVFLSRQQLWGHVTCKTVIEKATETRIYRGKGINRLIRTGSIPAETQHSSSWQVVITASQGHFKATVETISKLDCFKALFHSH